MDPRSMQDLSPAFWTPPRSKVAVVSYQDAECPSKTYYCRRREDAADAVMDCEGPPRIRSPSAAFTSEHDYNHLMEEVWSDVNLPVLLDLEYIEPGFSTPAPPARKSTASTKNKDHPMLFLSRQSVLQRSRPPWNSPDAMEFELTTENQENMTEDPPPPPTPSRRVCLVGLENFPPTPIFGPHFPDAPKNWNKDHKPLKRSFHNKNGEDDRSNTAEGRCELPKLTMKRTRYHGLVF